MSLRYRAIWADDRPDLLQAGRAIFGEWMQAKQLDASLHESGRADVAEGVEVIVAQVADDKAEALRIRLNEERSFGTGSQRWSTTAHWMADATGSWAWVDLEWVSDDPFGRPPAVHPPRLISMLIDDEHSKAERRLGVHPRRITSDAVDQLVEWMYSPDRTVPLIVFSVDTAITPEGYSKRVKETARRLVGCADVVMLTSESMKAFIALQHDQSMDVYDGACRVYLPNIDPSDPQPWRHRYVRSHLMTAQPEAAASRLSAMVVPRMVSMRPPELYRNRVRSLLDSATGEVTDWQAIALDRDDEVARLSEHLESMREERDTAFVTAANSERNANDALRRLDLLRTALRVQGTAPESIELTVGDEAPISSCREAIDRACDLEHVDIHPDAARDIDRMDESPQADLWGQRIWTHLQALDAYASDKGPGFLAWCEKSGHPRVISPKFISMTESESVRCSPRLNRHRRLAISTEVNPRGMVDMYAHLKPIEGGGMQVPRIYFHDDTKGTTGKIHVGFIGPHDLMPNLQSN